MHAVNIFGELDIDHSSVCVCVCDSLVESWHNSLIIHGSILGNHASACSKS